MPKKKRVIGPVGHALAAELRAEAARRSLLNKQLASLTGIPPSTVGKVLNADTVVDVDQLARLGEVFDVEPSELVRRAEEAAAKVEPFGDYVRRQRAERDLTPAQFARKVHVGVDAVRGWEDGSVLANDAEQQRVLKLFGDLADVR